MTDQRSDPSRSGVPPRAPVPDVWNVAPARPQSGPPPWNGRNGGPPPPQPAGPPPGARPGYGPPPGRPAPQRFGPPPHRPGPMGPPGPGREAPLLTHDAGVSGPDDRPTSLAVAEPPGPPSAGPPRGRGGGGDGEGRRPKGKRVRRIAFWTLGVLILAPFVAFAVGWMIFPVPTAQDAANTQVATFTFADGSPLATVRPNNINRTNVTLDQVPKHVQEAVLSAEDRSFFTNPGFDVSGIGRAVWNQLTGGIGGGSTITQQYIKVTTGQDQVSLLRKYKEIVLAAKISKEQTKEQILENYLNAIYLGRGAYGIQAASQAYFGKDVGDLTPSEGAMIAGLIQSPSRWDPAKNLDRSQQRWAFVLDGMVQQGWMSPSDRAQQVFPQWQEASASGGGIPGDANGHIYNQVRAELEENGISESEINTEGLTVETTIDPAAQKAAVDAANDVMKGQPDNLRTALVSIDPKTGAVLAYFGGNDGVGLDYAQASKQPGSSFKPFVFAAGLQQPDPIGLGTQYDGSSPQTLAGVKVSNSEGVSCNQCSVKTAMTQSINTVFYRMALDVGPQKVADAAAAAGIPAEDLKNPTGGIALGDKNLTTENMAAAYATFAADGVRHDPFMVRKVTTSDGRVIFDHTAGAASGTQAFSQQVARNVTESMTDVASASRIGLGGRPVAAKTGTVQSSVEGQNNDAWTVGYTPSISTAVWVGTDDNSPIKNSAGRPIYGRMLPGSIWQEFMTTALRGTPTEQFSKFTPLGQAPVSDNAGQDQQDGNGNGNGGQDADGNGQVDPHERGNGGNGNNGDNGDNGNRNNGGGNGGGGNGDGGNGGGGNGNGGNGGGGNGNPAGFTDQFFDRGRDGN
ncbi:transglycosylase domain-containing protein [Pseudonocardia sp. WMMC193]|uniref:transglycosylase domain-containing protein n=1 Tax=Pseudonocardia sp. WMMC193 TaxID=2911965 RepID=UPI001F1ACBDB|nr:transglycosylase domain-containing protein [Pseudonocardia sp. WMMC193]MCF7551965.1 penicillin-binding protein [Pseudonocardia sp. WMMC193]